jgi:arylsulfatase A-like enzyme
MPSRDPGPDAENAPAHGRAVAGLLQTGLLGVVVFAALGALEAGAFAWRFDDPQPLGVLRRAVLLGGAAGAAAGLAWGALTERLDRRHPVRRRLVQPAALAVLWATLVLGVHTQRHGLPAGAPVGGALSLAAAGGHALAALMLLAALRRVGRCAPDTPGARGTHGAAGRPIGRPVRWVGAAGALLLGALALPDACVPDSTARGPDVLLVVLDTTRADRFPPDAREGSLPVPHFEALAREGVLFAQARSASPWTLPSHASMFTGALPSEHGATSEHTRLDGRLPTLAERLAAEGLHTVAFARKGWLNRQTGVMRGFAQSFDLLDPAPRPALLELYQRLFEPAEPDDQGGRWLTTAASEWFLAHPDVPRFAFLNYDEAHSPLRPPEPYRRAALGEDADTPWGRERVPHAQRHNTGLETYSAEDFAVFQRLYDAEIAYQDELLGGLLRALEGSGRLDDTLVIVTSDHGEHLGEHGLLGHDFSLYDTVLRVPLVLRWPAGLPRGLVIDAPVETRRLGALIDALRAHDPASGPMPAERLVGLLTGPLPGGALDGPAIVSELYRPPFGTQAWEAYPRRPEFDRRMKSLLHDGTKYIWGSDGRDELYAPRHDPGELHDLLATEPGRAQALRAALLADPRLWPEWDAREEPVLGEALLEHLRETGYLR